MAKELGLNPKKFGKIDNHEQELWKAPLSVFIQELHQKRFKKIMKNQLFLKEKANASFFKKFYVFIVDIW